MQPSFVHLEPEVQLTMSAEEKSIITPVIIKEITSALEEEPAILEEEDDIRVVPREVISVVEEHPIDEVKDTIEVVQEEINTLVTSVTEPIASVPQDQPIAPAACEPETPSAKPERVAAKKVAKKITKKKADKRLRKLKKKRSAELKTLPSTSTSAPSWIWLALVFLTVLLGSQLLGGSGTINMVVVGMVGTLSILFFVYSLVTMQAASPTKSSHLTSEESRRARSISV
jgi:hypothetical protein